MEKFMGLGLIQRIKSPTHKKGNILDILFTNSEQYLKNIEILSNSEICASDHHAITFDHQLKIERKKAAKRKQYNYNRADWDTLNNDINNFNWPAALDMLDSNSAWMKFKGILNHILELHIPKVTVKYSTKPPWFDTECYIKCREKERLHKKFKHTMTISDELKFKNCRREFKQLVRSKIRDNLYSSNDSSIITKKFWSHVKSKSKSERIPEIIKFSNKISSDDITKANLFNDFFHEQFSEDSKYDIDIDHRQDEEIDIDFSCTRIKQLLNNIHTNKSPGPDDIHGKVLKHCAKSICRPLSLIFNIVYKSGKLPIEWKQANVVPVHKKGDKMLVDNYRPISLTCLIAKVMEHIIQDELLSRTQNS